MKMPHEIEQEIDAIGDWVDVNKSILPDAMTFNQMVILIDLLIDIYDMNDARKNICDCVEKMSILQSILMNGKSVH
ncbi:MAG: hypothetical protein ACR2M9_03580 [Cyanophyceae cyanobacterium]